MRRYIALLLAVMLLGITASGAFAVVYGRGGYESEGYSEATAWEIDSAEVLARLRDDVNANKLQYAFYVKLTKDIDLTGYQRWTPIGGTAQSYFEEPRYTRYFRGHFDGNGHTITVNISELETDSIRLHHGLFGIVLGGSIKNLNVAGNIEVFMRASSAPILVGGIASYLVEGSIENCRFNGNIKAENQDGNLAVGTMAGGIVARAGYSFYIFSIKNCKVGSCSDTVITASDALAVKHTYAGGIAAYLDDNTYQSKSSTVSGNYIRAETNGQYSGGICGARERGTGVVRNNTEDDPSEPPPDTANLTITTASLPSGNIGDTYSETITAVMTGGTWPVTWAVESGTLPAGLTLNSSSGTISGSPTAKGTYKFTVKASIGSSGLITASKEYSVIIADNQPSYSLTVKNTSLTAGTVGTSYSETLKAELTGAELPATWSYTGTLPPGLTLSTSGAISGIPTVAGEYTFTVTAVFGAFMGEKTLTLKINSGGSSIETPEYEDMPEFKTQSLLLSGQIGLNFYMSLPKNSGVNYSDKNCYMEFDVNGDSKSNNPQPYDPEFMNARKEYYGFRCYINSIQMADPITATFHYGSGKTITKTYSAKTYIDTVMGMAGFSDEVKALMSAMMDYGHYMQIFLSESKKGTSAAWKIGVDHEEMPCANVYTDSDVQKTTQEVKKYAADYDISNSDITKLTYSLVLDSETALNIYLTPSASYTGNVSAYLGGGRENLAVKQADGRYRVQISGISAHLLGEMHTIRVIAGGTFDIKISALSYVNAVLSSSAFGNSAKQGVTSLYKYYTSAIAYQESINK